MRIFSRFLSVLSLSALMSVMSGSSLLAQDDRQYDPQAGDQSRSYDSQPQYPDQQGQQYDARLDSQADPRRDEQPQQPDPPARAARLQFMSGSVSIQPHGVDDWVAGALNRPLTNSDNIWADKDSRAELSVGTGVVRIDSESSLTLTNVGENIVQLQLHQGAMNLHVRRLYDGETYEVDTPNQAFTVLKPGDYRFDVDPNADTTVITVWSGLGESTGDGPAVRIRANYQVRFSNGTSLHTDMHQAPAQDGFDEWAAARDTRFDHSESARYVSPDVVGSEDLDEYGTWRESPEYGNIWVPSQVDVGWAPYRYGHWIWVAPWGWTWVEDEPWGYAPFHYGRWVYYNNYWGWAPGPIYVRSYYSPALVAWFGGGGWGASIGFGFGGGYGWCPLGFGEPFIPWYGVSREYFSNVNITNTRITNITNIYNTTYINNHRGGRPGEPIHYANMRSPNGFTAVSRDTLVNSRPVARNNIRVSPNELTRISAVRNPELQPNRSTMLGPNGGRSAAVPPQRAFARPVVNHITPPAGSRVGSPVAGRNESPAMRGPQRPGDNIANRGIAPNNSMRMPDRGASSYPRSVPRPPSASGPNYDSRGSGSRGGDYSPRSNAARPAYQPSPRADSRLYSQPSYDRGSSRPSPSYGGTYQRPAPAPSYNRSAPSYDRGPSSRPSPSYGGGGGYQRPAPAPSYNRPAPSYDRGPSSRPSPSSGGGYQRPAPAPSYDRPAPSYDRGSTSRPSPSYGGGGGYQRPAPAPSYSRPAPSYGGGGRAPSYGGGGGRPSGGGYSDGGRASAPPPSHNFGGGSQRSNDSHGHH